VKGGPTVADTSVYVGSEPGLLHGLTLATGAPRWTKEIAAGVGTAPAVGGSAVMFGGDRRRVFSYTTNGERGWVYDTTGPAASPLALSDGVLYTGTTDGSLVAITEATGQARWTLPIGFPVAPPVAAAGVVYVGAGNGLVYAVDAATGQPKWQAATGGPVIGAPALVDGKLYIGSDDLYLHALDAATGTELWRFYAGGAVRAAPAVGAGFLVVPTVTGELIGVTI
jgi:outer membrane protein assembly factor BamB